jgi:hypothetical protein
MKRPTTVKVQGIKYKIKYDEQLEDAYGITDSDTNTISLCPMPEDKLIRVFVHELTHAVIFETPMYLRKRFDLEEVCDLVGLHFLAMLRDNKHVLEYILSEMDEEPNE